MSVQRSLSTSVVVQFASNLDGAILSVEVDGRPTGYNGGNTSFRPGDSPAFLVHKSPIVNILQILTTQGLVQYIGEEEDTVEEWVACAMEKEVRTKYPISAINSIVRSYGDPVTGYAMSNGVLRFPTPRLVSFLLSYKKKSLVYRITGSLGEAPVIVYVVGEAR